MSIDFTGVKSLEIPEGKVVKVIRKSDGIILWEQSKTFTFTMSDHISGLPLDYLFEFEEGMSWEEWANSEYNIHFVDYFSNGGSDSISFLQHEDGVEYEWIIFNGNEDLITAEEIIISGHNYAAEIEYMGPA